MDKRKKWGKKSFFSEMIWYFVLLLLVPLITIILIFNRADQMVRAQIQESATKDMKLYCEQIEDIVRNMQATGFSVLENNDCKTYSLKLAEDSKQEQKIKRSIYSYLQSLIDTRYHDVFVYFERDEICISGRYSALTAERYYDAYYGEFRSGEYRGEFLEMLKTTARKGSCHVFRNYVGKAYFCMAISCPGNGQESSGYTICVVLSPEYLKQTLLMHLANGDTVFQIYNENQQMILENAKSDDWQNALDDMLWDEMQDSGVWISREKYMIQKQTSEIINNTYLCIVPSTSYWNARQELRIFCYVAILICAVISACLAYRNAKKAYRPVKTLMNLVGVEDTQGESTGERRHEFDYIKDYIHTNDSRLREYRHGIKEWNLYHLLEGKFTGEDRELLEKSGVVLPYGSYAVCLFQIEAVSPKINDLYLFVIKNVLEELGNNVGSAYMMEIGKKRCALLMNFDGTEETVSKVLKTGEEFLREHFEIVMTIGRSMIHDRIEEIPEAYREAQEAVRYRFLVGVGNEISYDEIAKRHMKRQRNSESKIYMLLQDCVKEQRTEEDVRNFVERLMHIYEVNEEVSMDMANYFKREVVTSLGNLMMKSFSEDQNVQIRKKLMQTDTLSEFKQMLTVDLMNMCTQDLGKTDKDNLCERVKMYIDENYSDDQLSVNMLGKQMGVQPAYLSKQFKDYYGVSMLDYVASVRISHAKRLMGEHGLSVAEAGQRVGLSDGMTFNRNFKKIEGISPAEYKKLSKKGDDL